MFKRSCLQHSTARCCVTTPACLHHAGSADSRIHVPQRHRICQKEGHGCNEQAPRGALSGGRPAAAVPRHKGHMFARPLPPLHSQQRMLRLYTTSCKISKIARPCRRRQRLPASRNGAARRLSRGSRARLKEGGSSSAVLPCTRQHRQVAARWRPLRGCRAAAAPVQAFWACRPLAAVGFRQASPRLNKTSFSFSTCGARSRVGGSQLSGQCTPGAGRPRQGPAAPCLALHVHSLCTPSGQCLQGTQGACHDAAGLARCAPTYLTRSVSTPTVH